MRCKNLRYSVLGLMAAGNQSSQPTQPSHSLDVPQSISVERVFYLDDLCILINIPGDWLGVPVNNGECDSDDSACLTLSVNINIPGESQVKNTGNGSLFELILNVNEILSDPEFEEKLTSFLATVNKVRNGFSIVSIRGENW